MLGRNGKKNCVAKCLQSQNVYFKTIPSFISRKVIKILNNIKYTIEMETTMETYIHEVTLEETLVSEKVESFNSHISKECIILFYIRYPNHKLQSHEDRSPTPLS